MINKEKLKTNLYTNTYWESNIFYEDDYFSYKVQFDLHTLSGTLTLSPYITIKVKGEYRRRSKRIYRYTSESKKLIPYKHREIIRELLSIFEIEIVVSTLLLFERVRYDNPFSYLEGKNVES